MRRIVMAGAPTGCWTNLGDEAILTTMLTTLRSAFDAPEISVVSSNPDGYLAQYGCRQIPFRDLAAITEAVRQADLLILGGGSIFFDYWDVRTERILTAQHRGLELWAGLALLARAHGTPIASYGVGVGPLNSQAGRTMAAATLQLCDAVLVRDEPSAALARELGADPGSIHVTGDPVIGWELEVEPGPHDPIPLRVGAALRNWDLGGDTTDWLRTVGAGMRHALQDAPARISFVPFHRGVKWPLTDDTAAHEAVVGELEGTSTETSMLSVDLPWPERARALADNDIVVAMRYHAVVMALLAGAVPVAIAYDPKVTALMAEVGLPELTVPLDGALRAETLAAVIRHAVENRSELAATAARGLAALRERESQTGKLLEAVVQSRADADADAEPAPETAALATVLTTLRQDVSARPPELAAVIRAQPRDLPITQPVRRVAVLTNRLLDRETGKPCIGGVERYARDLATLMRDLGLEVTFFQRGGSWGIGDFHGFAVHALPEGGAVGEFEVGVTERFAEAARDFDHTLALVTNYASPALPDDSITVLHGVWWDHDFWPKLGFRSPQWQQQLEGALSGSRTIVSVDDNSVDVVRASFPSLAERMRVIPNAVDTDVFRPDPDRPSRSVPRVLFPRRAERIRGAQLVAPLLRLVPDPCEVVWCGEGDRKMITELKAAARTDGRLRVRTASLDEMPGLYRDADIVVIPSVASEGRSLAALEAMASGCAVVVTRVGGLAEVVTDEVDGLVCDPTPESLAAALRRLVRDPGLRRRLGAAARRSALRSSHVQWRQGWADLLAAEGWVTSTAGAVPYDLVCFAVVDWQFRFQRPQQLMRAWGQRGRRVFYVRVHDHLGPDAADPYELTEVAENVWEVRVSATKDVAISRRLPDEVQDRFLDCLARLRADLHVTNAVSVVQTAAWWPLVERTRSGFGWPVVYDCMDDWSTFPGFKDRAGFVRLERELVAGADAVVASSETIQDRWSAVRDDVALARNAVDVEFFTRQPISDPLPDVTGPIAGFYGSVVEWFDVALMRDVVRAHPDVTFVLVGNVARVDVSPLEALPNVRFEGLQPYELMPAYLHRFDVCLIPFEVSDTSAGMDVVKFYEYVSHGKPVVSTRIKEIERYGRYLYLADDAADFSRKLTEAFAESDPERVAARQRLAGLNTWHDRVDVLEHEIRRCLAARTDGPAAPNAAGKRPAPSAPAATGSVAPLVRERDALRAQLAEINGSRAMRVIRRYRRVREVGRHLLDQSRGGRRRV